MLDGAKWTQNSLYSPILILLEKKMSTTGISRKRISEVTRDEVKGMIFWHTCHTFRNEHEPLFNRKATMDNTVF